MRIERIGLATLCMADCMDVMATMPDDAFDVAIVDPPYGGMHKTASSKLGRFYGGNFRKYRNVVELDWDTAPEPAYFEELFRVSKRQVIWGGNNFKLPPSSNFIIWEKPTIPEGFSMAMAEFAWVSWGGSAKVITMDPRQSDRIHPTQKPEGLYKWVIKNYTKQGDQILDTHMGSGSSVVACNAMGHEITAVEKNETYFNLAVARIRAESRHQSLFCEPSVRERDAGVLFP